MNLTINYLNVQIPSTIIDLYIGTVYTFSMFALPLTTIFNNYWYRIMLWWHNGSLPLPL